MTTNTQPARVLTDDEIHEIADPFGFFKSGDSQGDVRLNFARAIESAIAAKQPATMQLEQGWQDIATAPKNSPVLVFAHGNQYVSWFLDSATDPYCVPGQKHDFDGLWCVDDNKHGPFALRGGNPTHWQPLPAPPLAAQGEKASPEVTP